MSKLWGGRFEKEMSAEVARFSSSMMQDLRLWRADIRGSIAHARMLGKQGIIPAPEAQQIVAGLEGVRVEIENAFDAGQSPFDLNAEDVHSEIERLLKAKIGPVAGKLHTARSRNDQVATACRLTLNDETQALDKELSELQTWIVETAAKETETLLPGLTHFQHAQPVSLAHHLLAYFWMIDRDRQRLKDFQNRCLVMPLGSAALAGTSFPLDRLAVAEALGFNGVAENSLDATSDRDFVIEFLSIASMIMMHMSRWSEELIIWSAPAHGFITLDDTVTTGSSIMPQKKNPDVAELIRGRVGRTYGALTGALTMMKGLPLAYNRDMQEDKVHLFQGFDNTYDCVRLMRQMMEGCEFHRDRMKASLRGDFSNATDLADDLAVKGVPFREAHEIVGNIVRHCISEKLILEDLKASDLKKFHTAFDDGSVKKMQHAEVMKARTSRGGTSPAAVREQIELARKRI